MKKTLFLILFTCYGLLAGAQHLWLPVGQAPDGYVRVLCHDAVNNTLYAGGAFTHIGGTAANYVAKFDGKNWTALGSGLNDMPSCMVLNGTKLYVGGSFTQANGATANNIAVWDTVSKTWSTLGGGMDGTINTLAFYNNELYAGGSFRTAGGNSISNIAKWNGSAWESVGGGLGESGEEVYCLYVYHNELYAGGSFFSADGGNIVVSFFARWDGSNWNAVDGDKGVDYSVKTMTEMNNDLYVGGEFYTLDPNGANIPSRAIAKWNGTNWSTIGEHTSNDVYTLYNDGANLNMGGSFTVTPTESPANRIAWYTGSVWGAYGAGFNNGEVYAIQNFKGTLFAGGTFAQSGGKNVASLAKWCDITGTINASSSTICLGSTVTLSSSGGTSYSWSTNESSSVITATPTSTTTYTVNISKALCTDTKTVTVSVYSIPTLTISPNQTICNGSTLSLSASGASSYLWSTGATTSSLVVASLSTTTTYTVVGTNGGLCSSTGSVTITVNALPNPIAGQDYMICNGDMVTLNGSGNGTYSWSPTTGLSCTTCAQPVASPTTNTSYTLTVTSPSCGSASDVADIVVGTSASLIVSPDVTICSGNSTTLSANGVGIYSWSPATGLSCTSCANPVANPTSTTGYVVTLTTAHCGSATKTVTVTVDNLVPVISGSNTICSGNTTTLSASGGDSYLWSTNESTSAIEISPTASAAYTVTVTNEHSCTANATYSVTVYELPTLVISGSNTICAGSSTTLTASGGDTYLWGTGETSTTIVVSPTVSSSYTVTAYNSHSCSTRAGYGVTVNALPTVSVTAVDASCSTCCDGSAFVITSGSSPFRYYWSNGQTTSAIQSLCEGTYTICVTDNYSCQVCSTVTVSSTTGIHSVSSENPSLRLYPNPFTDITTIEFGSMISHIKLSLTDVFGNVVYAESISNTDKFIFHKGDLPTGIYFLRATMNDGNIKTGKLIIE